MSLDDHYLPWSVASYLEKDPIDFNRRDWQYHEHLQLQAIESREAEEARSQNRMRQAARERPLVHYAGEHGPG